MNKPSSSAKGITSTVPVKRTRKQKGKSRSGCSRCKIRRVKCDETRPACRNCVKLEYHCPGFGQRLRWSSKHETGLTVTSNVTASNDLPEDRRPTNVQDGSNDQPEASQSNDPDFIGSDVVHDSQEYTSDALPVDADCCLQLALPSIWQPDTIDPAAFEATQMSECGNDPSSSQEPPISQSLTHLPTMLIEHWFRFVCPMWSTFDSDINYNRLLARSTWSDSGAVFFAMQAMSAACLLDSMPTLTGMLPALRTQATAAIKQAMDQEPLAISIGPKVTADLVFAVFALGTSSSWCFPAPMELPWLQVARKLLCAWEVTLSPQDRLLHAYFCQALIFWEMLSTISGLGSMADKVNARLQRHQDRLRQALLLPDAPSTTHSQGPAESVPRQRIWGTRPNSWCGVSNEVIDTFGQVLALCRSARQQTHSNDDGTMTGSISTLCSIAIAHELQRELLALDFGTLVSKEEEQGFSVQTQDDKTPMSHLVLTAEAYRQAGLLQLHLTFADLPRTCLNGRYDIQPAVSLFRDTTGGCVVDQLPHDEFVRSLSLHLLATLERIPTESGSRSRHSMLYLSAAAGLRFDNSPASQHGPPTTSTSALNSLFGERNDDSFGPSLDLGSSNDIQLHHDNNSLFLFEKASEYSASTDSSLGHMIASARQSILTRLSGLQQSVPQIAKDGTLQLVNALWSGYDAAFTGCPRIHWLDLVAAGPGTVVL